MGNTYSPNCTQTKYRPFAVSETPFVFAPAFGSRRRISDEVVVEVDNATTRRRIRTPVCGLSCDSAKPSLASPASGAVLTVLWVCGSEKVGGVSTMWCGSG
eukprot:scaffold330619_cov59-Tisochrysis_lutea.AAC.1